MSSLFLDNHKLCRFDTCFSESIHLKVGSPSPCLFICPSVHAFHYARLTGQTPLGILKKIKQHFPIKSGQPREMALTTFYSFSEFLRKVKKSRATDPGMPKWNGKFPSDWSDSSKWTTSRGGPEFFSGKEPKSLFPFNFRPIFPESLA